MFKHAFILLTALAVIGCSARPIRTVQYTDDGYIVAARTKSVEVQAQRTESIHAETDAWVDVWNIRLVNKHRKQDWCASIEWRHLDYMIQVPNVWFYLPAHSYSDIGRAVQQMWKLDKTTLTFTDAAFAVYRLNLKKPNEGQCVVKTE